MTSASGVSPASGDVPNTIDLDRFVDERPIGAFHINLLIWPLIATIADGFDLVVMGFAAPEIIKAFSIDRSLMGLILSASLIGLLIGSPIAGYLGDKFGRKPLMVSAVLLFGAATWATVLAGSFSHFFILRLLAGIGLAGIIPNVTALVTESIPRRVRGASLIVVHLGVQLGSIIPGLIAAYLVAKYGWEVLFTIGGACPMLLSIILIFVLPESVKFLALDPRRRSRFLKLVRAMDPRTQVNENTEIVQHLTHSRTSLAPTVPFQNGMHVITPLLWTLAGISLFTNLLIGSWAPTVLRDLGLPPEKAALTASLYGLGGVIGSVILIFGFNRYGFLIVVFFYLVGVPALALVGYVDSSLLPILIGLAGLCIAGSQSAINSALGMLYPTSIRANSAGWGMTVGRVGSIFGPIFGGYLTSHQMSGEKFFVIAAIPVALGVCISAVLTWKCWQRFHEWALHDRAAVEK